MLHKQHFSVEVVDHSIRIVKISYFRMCILLVTTSLDNHFFIHGLIDRTYRDSRKVNICDWIVGVGDRSYHRAVFPPNVNFRHHVDRSTSHSQAPQDPENPVPSQSNNYYWI